MAHVDSQQPSKIFRGTVDEVFSHRREIPPGATVELRVLHERPETGEGPDNSSGKSLADRILEIGTVQGLPPDLSTNPKYMEGLGETRNLRTL